MTAFISLCSHELSSVQGHKVAIRSPGVMHRKALRLAWGPLSYVKTEEDVCLFGGNSHKHLTLV